MASRTAAEGSRSFNFVDRISLPNTYTTWPKLCDHLRALSGKSAKGPEAFQQTLERDGENIALALLEKVLGKAQYISDDHFYETLLPWLASKALQVESLFEESNYTILVCRACIIRVSPNLFNLFPRICTMAVMKKFSSPDSRCVALWPLLFLMHLWKLNKMGLVGTSYSLLLVSSHLLFMPAKKRSYCVFSITLKEFEKLK